MTQNSGRAYCYICYRPQKVCLCDSIVPIKTNPLFIILIHPRETKKKIGTGRLAHLMLKDSYFFEGIDFTHHELLNKILQSKNIVPYLVFPGDEAYSLTRNRQLSTLPQNDDPSKRPCFIVVDGTWPFAKKMIRLSKNLQALSKVMLFPQTESQYLIRKQPKSGCLSTIESIHEILECLETRMENNRLLDVFRKMVDKQITIQNDPNVSGYRRCSFKGDRLKRAK